MNLQKGLEAMSHHYDAVLFDLLSALLDSWSLWDDLAGDSTLGRAWRMHYLEAASNTAHYLPYISLVAESAAAVGVEPSQAEVLATRWSELKPWPEAEEVVARIASTRKVGLVTNCSESLGARAADKFGVEFDVVLTAERAGYYKPDRRAYLRAVEEIGVTPERILYVAGSPYDVRGAAATGMPVYWHNRTGLVESEIRSMTIRTSNTLEGLRDLIHPVYGAGYRLE